MKEILFDPFILEKLYNGEEINGFSVSKKWLEISSEEYRKSVRARKIKLLKKVIKKFRFLTGGQGVCLYLYLFQGYTEKEIANCLGIKQQTVSGIISRAVKKIKETIKKEKKKKKF